jgi:hypothetical protein
MKKIKFTTDSLLYNYDLDQVVETVKYSVKKEKNMFQFDTNFNMIHFFNHFIEVAEDTKSYEKAQILKDFLDAIVSELPKNLKEVVDFFVEEDLLSIDEGAEEVFSSTTPEVITAYLYPATNLFIQDEFLLNYEKNPLFDNLKKELGLSDMSEITYAIMSEISKKLKEKYPQGSYTQEDFEPTEDDLLLLKVCPKNVQEAVDYLVKLVSQNSKNINVDFDQNDSVDVFSSYLFSNVGTVLFSSWYMFYKDAPLRVWFKENRQIDDPHYIVYYIVRTFSNYLIAKEGRL